MKKHLNRFVAYQLSFLSLNLIIFFINFIISLIENIQYNFLLTFENLGRLSKLSLYLTGKECFYENQTKDDDIQKVYEDLPWMELKPIQVQKTFVKTNTLIKASNIKID